LQAVDQHLPVAADFRQELAEEGYRQVQAAVREEYQALLGRER
jgi:hypothetical protein